MPLSCNFQDVMEEYSMTKVLCSCVTQVLILLKKQAKVRTKTHSQNFVCACFQCKFCSPSEVFPSDLSGAVVLGIGHRNHRSSPGYITYLKALIAFKIHPESHLPPWQRSMGHVVSP